MSDVVWSEEHTDFGVRHVAEVAGARCVVVERVSNADWQTFVTLGRDVWVEEFGALSFAQHGAEELARAWAEREQLRARVRELEAREPTRAFPLHWRVVDPERGVHRIALVPGKQRGWRANVQHPTGSRVEGSWYMQPFDALYSTALWCGYKHAGGNGLVLEPDADATPDTRHERPRAP